MLLEPPQEVGAAPKAPQQKASWFWFFRLIDLALHAAEPYFPARLRKQAIARALQWVNERLNREDGLTVVVSLHQIDYAFRYCHRSVAMKDGEVVYDGPTREISDDLLQHVYGKDLTGQERHDPLPATKAA